MQVDLYSGELYWPDLFPDAPSFPELEEDLDCDVLIIGSGSSGAQCAYMLSQTGLSLAVVDKRKAGRGSTAASTGLLQYFGDRMFFELANEFGERPAIRHAELCAQAIREIGSAARQIPFGCGYALRDSLYTASSRGDADKLRREFDLLVPHGFRVDWWSEDRIADAFCFGRPAALYFHENAEIDPFRYTLGLLETANKRGVPVYENTEITDRWDERDAVVFRTRTGRRIRAKHAVVAGGYETLAFHKEANTVLTGTFAVVTEPVEDLTDWYRRLLMWETAWPYLYMRTTPDNRIIIGGLDEDPAAASTRDTRIQEKSEQLIRRLGGLFPRVRTRAAYRIGAVFGRIRDGLPMLGRFSELPRCSFVYAYGDNGLVYGMLLARLLRDELTGTPSPGKELYLPGRRAVATIS